MLRKVHRASLHSVFSMEAETQEVGNSSILQSSNQWRGVSTGKNLGVAAVRRQYGA